MTEKKSNKAFASLAALGLIALSSVFLQAFGQDAAQGTVSKESIQKALETLNNAPINPDASGSVSKSDIENSGLPVPVHSSIVLPVSALQVPEIASGVKLTVSDPESNVAIEGYDPVGYFTLGEATKGSSEHTAVYQGATYYFASAENRDLFLQSSDKYAPAYGGYCTETLAHGRLTPGDPTSWTVHGNRLYLTRSNRSTKGFREHKAKSLVRANENWVLVEEALRQPDPNLRQHVQ